MIADPRHRQVRKDAVVGGQPVEFAAAPRGGDERAVRLAHALRLARRPRRVEHHGNVGRIAARDLLVVEARMRAVEFAALRLQALEARDALVVAQPARVVVVDVLQRRHLRRRFQHLVDLLLILDDRVRDLGVVQHVDEFAGGRILVHGDGNAAQRLRRGHGPVQARPVVADDREVHPAAESLRREPAGEGSHLRRHLAPGPRLPDAEVLLADGRVRAADLRMMREQPRKSIESGRGGIRWHCFVLLAARRGAHSGSCRVPQRQPRRF